MMFSGVVAMVGPIPSAGGQARSDLLRDRGMAAQRAAMRSHQQAVDELEALIGPVAMPWCLDPIAAPNLDDAGHRLDAWTRIRAKAAAATAAGTDLAGEASAREALRQGIWAFRDLTGSAKESSAHRQMHRYAEMVAGLYGCWMKWDKVKGLWFDTCPLRHAHRPYGFSMGFTATRLCSICRQEISECVHFGYRPYTVTVARYLEDEIEKCSVCHEPSCGHVLGEQAEVFQWQLMRDIKMHEISITPSPREPRCMLMEIELIPQPPPPSSPGARLQCTACLVSCGGPPEPGPLA